MRIIGHGIDIVETSRIARLLDHHPDRFLARCYSDAERAYATDKRRRVEHLAGRFAAKEAVMKALGTGWADGVAWTDISILRGDQGQPHIRLTGQTADLARRIGIDQWWISISHIKTHAVASAIAAGPLSPHG